jgi:hypothetical protein
MGDETVAASRVRLLRYSVKAQMSIFAAISIASSTSIIRFQMVCVTGRPCPALT